MPVRATCPVCGVALFSPSEALTAQGMVDRHQRFGRCRSGGRPGAQVERSAVTEEDGRPGAATTRRDGRLV
jgi:hypothetical protein